MCAKTARHNLKPFDDDVPKIRFIFASKSQKLKLPDPNRPTQNETPVPYATAPLHGEFDLSRSRL